MRVLLATDRPDLGHALSLFLSERRIQVLDVIDCADALLRKATATQPDVVVVDWRLGEAASTELVAHLMSGEDPTPVIVLSSTRERARARRCGAAAYATLGDPPETLLAAIREAGCIMGESEQAAD